MISLIMSPSLHAEQGRMKSAQDKSVRGHVIWAISRINEWNRKEKPPIPKRKFNSPIPLAVEE
jgi:hypothetical protein